MARRPHPEHVALSIRVPRGQQGFWELMCEHTRRQGTFTVADIDGGSNVEASTIRDYLRRLVIGGYVVVAGEEPGQGTDRKRYRVEKPRADAPRLRRDGTELAREAQWRLWTAMRGLRRGFTIRELAFTAGLDEPVRQTTAASYVKHLHQAGYLTVVGRASGPQQRTYRLVRNTGPKPPRILRTKAVWDDNSLEIVGPSQTEVAS